MADEISILFPSKSFFAAGQYAQAAALVLLQLTIVLWPVSVRLARNHAEARGAQRLLDDMSRRYAATGNRAMKRFRSG